MGGSPAVVEQFADRRLQILGRQLIYFERPDLLTDALRRKYDRAISSRLMSTDADTAWLTLPSALAELEALLAQAAPREVELLLGHKVHLCDWMSRANATLAAS